MRYRIKLIVHSVSSYCGILSECRVVFFFQNSIRLALFNEKENVSS